MKNTIAIIVLLACNVTFLCGQEAPDNKTIKNPTVRPDIIQSRGEAAPGVATEQKMSSHLKAMKPADASIRESNDGAATPKSDQKQRLSSHLKAMKKAETVTRGNATNSERPDNSLKLKSEIPDDQRGQNTRTRPMSDYLPSHESKSESQSINQSSEQQGKVNARTRPMSDYIPETDPDDRTGQNSNIPAESGTDVQKRTKPMTHYIKPSDQGSGFQKKE